MTHQATSLLPDPIATRDMQAAVAKALAERLSSKELPSGLKWLPANVYRAISNNHSGKTTTVDHVALNSGITMGVGARPPTVLIFKANSTPEHQAYLQAVTHDADNVHHDISFTIANESKELQGTFRGAQSALVSLWPEAAAELALLVREVVVVADTDLTASHDSMFGCIFVGTEMLKTTTDALEALLHEGGHTALYLRSMFCRFLENPDKLASHPLRPDPRPLSGVLHAGFVLSRIVEGLNRWVISLGKDAPERTQATARYLAALQQLEATLAALDENAEWTPDGYQLRQTMGTPERQHSDA